MYINYDGAKYVCNCVIDTDTITYTGLPVDFPAPAEGLIELCANDGFVLRVDNTASYLRQTFEDGVLVLTDRPEVEYPPEEEASIPTVWDELDAAYKEGVDSI